MLEFYLVSIVLCFIGYCSLKKKASNEVTIIDLILFLILSIFPVYNLCILSGFALAEFGNLEFLNKKVF